MDQPRSKLKVIMPSERRVSPKIYYVTTIIVLVVLVVVFTGNNSSSSSQVETEKERPIHNFDKQIPPPEHKTEITEPKLATHEPKIIYIPANCTNTDKAKVEDKEPNNGVDTEDTKVREISDDDAYEAIRNIAAIVKDGGTRNCEFKGFGANNGRHELCDIKVNSQRPCR